MKYTDKILNIKDSISKSELDSSLAIAIQECIKERDLKLFIKLITKYASLSGWKVIKVKDEPKHTTTK